MSTDEVRTSDPRRPSLAKDWRTWYALISYPVVLAFIPLCWIAQCAITAWHVAQHFQDELDDWRPYG